MASVTCDHSVSSFLLFLLLQQQTRKIQASTTETRFRLSETGRQVKPQQRLNKRTSAGSYQGLRVHRSGTSITTSLFSVSFVYLLLQNFEGTVTDFHWAAFWRWSTADPASLTIWCLDIYFYVLVLFPLPEEEIKRLNLL